MFHKSGLLVALVSLVAHVASVSTYIMDDRNASISYSPSNAVDQFADSGAYDGTLTSLGIVGACDTSSNCQMSLSFTGSGITLYAYMLLVLSFNISIDGMALSHSHFDGIYGCCGNAFSGYNFTIYDVQNLPLGDHVLVLRLLDTFSYNYSGNSGSALHFDYAVVNETAMPPSTSPHQRLGLAIGGALGGTAALALAALVVIYIRRQSPKRDAPESDPYDPTIVTDKQEQEKPIITAGLWHDSAPVPPVEKGSNAQAAVEHQLHAEHDVPLTITSFTTSTSHPPLHHETPPTYDAPPTAPPFTPSTSHAPPHHETPPTHDAPPTTPPFTPSTSHAPPHHETPTPPTSRSEEEESQRLARIYTLEVPTGEIARVMNGMRARRQAEDSGALPEDADAPQPPPYEL